MASPQTLSPQISRKVLSRSPSSERKPATSKEIHTIVTEHEESDDEGVVKVITTTTKTTTVKVKDTEKVPKTSSAQTSPGIASASIPQSKTSSVQTSPGITNELNKKLLLDSNGSSKKTPENVLLNPRARERSDSVSSATQTTEEPDGPLNSNTRERSDSVSSGTQTRDRSDVASPKTVPQEVSDSQEDRKQSLQRQSSTEEDPENPPVKFTLGSESSSRAPTESRGQSQEPESQQSRPSSAHQTPASSPRTQTLKKKVCLVVGGAKGIGKAFCKGLLEKGALVCCADKDNVAGNLCDSEFAGDYGEDNFFYAECDITKDGQVNELFDRVKNRYGVVEVVVNCAAVLFEKEWKKTIDVNVKGAMLVVKGAVKQMDRSNHGKGGTVVLMSALAAYQGFLPCPTYAATMGMMSSLARAWSHPRHYETTNIRFNAISPGIVSTKLWNALDKDLNVLHDREAKVEINGTKWVTLDQCVHALYTILEDGSMNGENIIVSAEEGVFVDEGTAQYRDLQ